MSPRYFLLDLAGIAVAVIAVADAFFSMRASWSLA